MTEALSAATAVGLIVIFALILALQAYDLGRRND